MLTPSPLIFSPTDASREIGPLAGTGHSANSQLGPERPTAEPSGQSFASIVHAAGLGALATRALIIHTPMATKTANTPISSAYRFILKV